MSTALDTKIAAKVASVLAKYGVNATFKADIGRGYDPETGKSTRIDTQTFTVKSTPPAAYRTQDVDGERIRSNDMQIYVGGTGLAFTPEIGHSVTVAGETWTVVAVAPVYSGDDIAVYGLQVRR